MSTALAPLWQISSELLALMDTIDLTPDEQKAEIQAEIDRFIGQEAAKVDQVAHVLSALEYEQRAASDEIARLQERKKAAKTAQDRLEQYVCRVIKMRGVKKLAGNTNALSIRPSDAVVITDDSIIPSEYIRETVTLPHSTWGAVLEAVRCDHPILFADLSAAGSAAAFDKTAIKKALKYGDDVPGADLEYRDNLARK